jgi:hypothetical protein
MHYPQHKTLQRTIVVCYIKDDSWRKCRLLDHGYNAVAMTWARSHVVPSILHRLLTEEVEKGQILLGHTYPTTSSRRRGRRAKFGWDRFRNVDLYKVQKRWKQTNKNGKKKKHFIFICKKYVTLKTNYRYRVRHSEKKLDVPSVIIEAVVLTCGS